MDDKSGMMKYQPWSNDGIIPSISNGHGKSVHVQDDKVFVCDTDSKRNKLNKKVKERHRRNIVLDWHEKQIAQKRNPQNHESPHQKSCESRNTQTFESDTRN